jgi:protein TonB
MIVRKDIECSNLALLNYIYKNLKYPRMAREYGVQGSAIAQFVIDKDGSITDINIKRGLCQDIKNEIIRLLRKYACLESRHSEG